MENLTLKFFVYLFYMGLLSSHHFTHTSVILQENPDWYLQERGDIPLTGAGLLDVYKKGDGHHVLVTTFSDKCLSNGSVFVLNSTILKHFIPNLLKGGPCFPRSVQRTPDNAFEFPAITISFGTVTGNSPGGMKAVDVSNFTNPKFYDIISPSNEAHEYNNPVWPSHKEFLVCHGYNSSGLVKWNLTHFENEGNNPWKDKLLKNDVCDFNMVLYEKIHGDFDALYAIDRRGRSLNLIWPEKRRGKPGSWKYPNQIKKTLFAKGDFIDIELVDLNKDGERDLLVSVTEGRGEVRAYEIPRENFRNSSMYREKKLAKNLASSDNQKMCPFVLKTFLPYKGYTGKPWLLVSGGSCGDASYLVPQSLESHNWEYRRFTILKGSNQSLVLGVEAVDIDEDGFPELFISLNDRNIIKVLSLKKVESTTATAETTASFVVAKTTTTSATTSTESSTPDDCITTASTGPPNTYTTIGLTETSQPSFTSPATSDELVSTTNSSSTTDGVSSNFGWSASSSPTSDGDNSITRHSSSNTVRATSDGLITGNSPTFAHLVSGLSSPAADDDDDDDDGGGFTSDNSVSTNAAHDTSSSALPPTEGMTTATNFTTAVYNNIASSTSGEFESASTIDSTDGLATAASPTTSTSKPFSTDEGNTDAVTVSTTADDNTTEGSFTTIGYNASSSSSRPDEVGSASTDSADGLTTVVSFPTDAGNSTSKYVSTAVDYVTVTSSSDDDNNPTTGPMPTIGSVVPSSPGEIGSKATSTDSADGSTTTTANINSSPAAGDNITSKISPPIVSSHPIFSNPSTADVSTVDYNSDTSSTPADDDDDVFRSSSRPWISTTSTSRIHSTTKATTPQSSTGLKLYVGCAVFVFPVMYSFMAMCR